MIRRAEKTIPWPFATGEPACIAHRGASAHAPENTLSAFRVASQLGAEMWEVDVQLTADDVPVIAHDAGLTRIAGIDRAIADLDFQTLRDLAPDIPSLDETLDLAAGLDQALYIELKAAGAGRIVWRHLLERSFARVALGSFNVDEIRSLADAGCPFPLATLVPLGADPFARADETRADIIHLCWEKGGGERPERQVDTALLERAKDEGLGVVLWHEERKPVLDALMKLPVLGICTNQPELMRGFDRFDGLATQIVCHRGANHFAPENTLAAARLSFDQGAHFVEIDVHMSADGAIVVIHDETLERTTSGTGAVRARTLAELKALSAGAWFSPFYAAETIPTLDEMIALARSYGARLYIENKTVDAQVLVDFVRARNFLGDCFFWSENPSLQEAMRQVAPDANIKASAGRYQGVEEMQGHLAPQLAEIHYPDYARLAPQCLAKGITPMMQYFGDDPAIFDRIVEIAPPLINLDRADLLAAALRRRIANGR
nr:glycerophosphodiester phosphodiesterase family protein [Martelella lutilitoris]